MDCWEGLWHRTWRSSQMGDEGRKYSSFWGCNFLLSLDEGTPQVTSTIHLHDLNHILPCSQDRLLSSTSVNWATLHSWPLGTPPNTSKKEHITYITFTILITKVKWFCHRVVYHKQGIENIFHHPPNYTYVPLQSIPPSSPGHHWSDFWTHGIKFSRMSCKWNHRVYSLLCLSPFTEPNAFGRQPVLHG